MAAQLVVPQFTYPSSLETSVPSFPTVDLTQKTPLSQKLSSPRTPHNIPCTHHVPCTLNANKKELVTILQEFRRAECAWAEQAREQRRKERKKLSTQCILLRKRMRRITEKRLLRLQAEWQEAITEQSQKQLRLALQDFVEVFMGLADAVLREICSDIYQRYPELSLDLLPRILREIGEETLSSISIARNLEAFAEQIRNQFIEKKSISTLPSLKEGEMLFHSAQGEIRCDAIQRTEILIQQGLQHMKAVFSKAQPFTLMKEAQ
jgi:hypothetical protein